MSFSAAFRVDAGSRIGLGHVSRSLALAKELLRAGARVVWIARRLPAEWRATLISLGIELYTLPDLYGPSLVSSSALAPGGAPWERDAHHTLQILGSTRPPFDLLVVDHYELDAKWESRMRSLATMILAIDDAHDDRPGRAHDCDFLLDPAASRAPRALTHVPSHCRSLTGTGYALVDPEYARWRLHAMARRAKRGGTGAATGPQATDRDRTAQPVRRVLVSFGGVDHTNATAKAIEALRRCEFEGEVDVVLGELAPHLHAVKGLVEQSLPQGRLHVGRSNLASLMAFADLAIGAAGNTSWERCTLGLPSIVISTAPNQQNVARALAEQAAALYLGDDEKVTVDALAQALRELLTDRDRLASMAHRAATLCDGLGAARVALHLLPERAKDGGAVTLRRMEPGDREQLYAWQTDPSTRRYSRTPKPPVYEEHCRWFAAKLSDPACLFHMIEHDGVAAGVVRLDPLAMPRTPGAPEDSPAVFPGDSMEATFGATFEAAFEVSILVDPAKKGRGIGKAALKALRRLIPWATLHAWVHPENTASQRLFESAGYSWVGDRYISRPAPMGG